MRIFNSDGTEPEMCGNGIRCLARFVATKDADAPRKYKIHTLAGAQTLLHNPLTRCLLLRSIHRAYVQISKNISKKN